MNARLPALAPLTAAAPVAAAAPVGSEVPLRVLTFTSLFPSPARPRHGIFVETRLRHLLRNCAVDARVVAPVPWFPFDAPMFGRYAAFAATPRRAGRGGLEVMHPRYWMLPRVGVAGQPDRMAVAAERDIEAIIDSGWTPELIDAHYLYPDGVAAAIVAERLRLPLVLTARGTDVNVLARMPAEGRRILWAARRADAVVAVSSRLKQGLVEIGVEAERIVVLRNGVDTELFWPEDREAARRRLHLPGPPLLACVGNLVEEKGHALAIAALVHLPGCRLVIAGDGPRRNELLSFARRQGVLARLSLLDPMPQADLRALYSAADLLLLPSLREGWPNVVLEAMACGTPVVASDAGAVAEMLTDPAIARVVAAREPRAFARTVSTMLEAPPPRDAVRRHAAAFDWATVSRAQYELFRRMLRSSKAGAALRRLEGGRC